MTTKSLISTRSVLITGCSSGIGYEVAHGLKKRGYSVFATARKANDVARLQQEGLESLVLDLNDSKSIHTAVESILNKTNGKLYCLFNNAAYGLPGAVEDISREALREQFETNLFGTHELTCKILPIMRKQGEGRIIQNSSVFGFVALSYRGAYNASKFALEGLTDTLTLELANTNIKICLIEPGPITSKFRANAYLIYKKHINPDQSVHKENYLKMEQRLLTEGDVYPFTLPPEAVLKKVIHALESKNPKIRYYVTFLTYLFGYLKRILPDKMMNKILKRVTYN